MKKQFAVHAGPGGRISFGKVAASDGGSIEISTVNTHDGTVRLGATVKARLAECQLFDTFAECYAVARQAGGSSSRLPQTPIVAR